MSRYSGAVVVVAVMMLAGSSAWAMGPSRPEPLPEPSPAPAQIELGAVTAGGTGCVGGNVETSISQDHRNVRVRFNRFEGELTQGRSLERKACSLSIPVVTAAEGMSIVISKVSMKGVRAIDGSATVQAGFEAFVAGGTGPRMEETFGAGDVGGPFELIQRDVAALGCGATGVLRVNASAVLKAVEAMASAFARIEEIELSLSLEPCGL